MGVEGYRKEFLGRCTGLVILRRVYGAAPTCSFVIEHLAKEALITLEIEGVHDNYDDYLLDRYGL